MRLIDADKLEKKLMDAIAFGRIRDLDGTAELQAVLSDVENMPTIDPELKTGKWQITDAYPHNVYCSECHKKFAQTQWTVWEDGSLPRNFCPNCGAKMEEGEADEAD